MEKIARIHVLKVIEGLLQNGSYKAEKYISENLVIRATRKLGTKGLRKRDNIEVLLIIGKPNFAQKSFIKDCKKAKESFPVKRIILKGFPKRKK